VPNYSFHGNQTELYKENVVLVLNAMMKNKFAKYKQVFDEVLLGLFLSRMKVLSMAHTLEL